MTMCPQCGDQVASGKNFCGTCGARVDSMSSPTTTSGSSGGRRKGKAKKGFIFMALFMNVAIGAVVFFAISGGGGSSDEQGFFEGIFGFNSVEGKLKSTGAPLGDTSFSPKVCSSGEHENFYGVYLGQPDDQKPHLKLIKDPDKGYLVKVHGCEPECKTLNLTKKKCDTFSVKVERTNTSVNDIWAVDGRVKLDCRFKSGGEKVELKGKVTFEGCY